MRSLLRVFRSLPALCVVMAVMTGCLSPSPEPPRRHDCPSESLLVNTSVFPEGTVADEPMSSLPDGGGTSIGVDMGNGEIDVSQLIYPYRTPKGAEGRFDEELQGVTKGYGEMTPIDLPDLALAADRYDFRCSDTETHPRCFYLARYDNFYIELILRTRSLDTPVDVLIPAIQDIDGRMTKCFEEHPAP